MVEQTPSIEDRAEDDAMSIQIEEKSLELAIVKAAGRLGITQSELAYKIIGKNEGFLGIFGKKIQIEAWPKKRSQDHAIDEFESIEDVQEDLRVFLTGIYFQMFGKHAEVQVRLDKNDRLIFDIKCPYLASQIKNNIKIAESMEHLLRKKPRYFKSELPFRIFVDANNARVEKENDLVLMAKDLSNKVYENQKPIILNYQSPYDRKVIHLALDKDKRVYTKSIGVGQNRKLMILPSKEANAQ
jgi:spoIIIJ-associated protein